MNVRLICPIIGLCFFSFAYGQVSKHGHAHNDYLHKNPLDDALSFGFSSIEVDVHKVGKQLKVSHRSWNAPFHKTLEELYLSPLKQRIQNGQGKIFNDSTVLQLMIDIKGDPNKVYPLLKQVILPYKAFIAIRGSDEWAPLKIVLSGRRRPDSLFKDNSNLFFLDANLFELKSYSANELEFAATASASFKSNFGRKTKLTEEDKERIKQVIPLLKKHNLTGRFWATPEDEDLWKMLLELGMGWINVDDLERFRKFITQ
ncbi:MAG: hypothetical protein MRY83_14615 [Flavobacteriales bacterium]|nr:hypothetical protein [Flavobacteriales bacterium]